MKKIELKTIISECQPEELSAAEQMLVSQAIEATSRSYAPYSHYRVGAALLLANGQTVVGCNQENAAYPDGLCAERTAIFAAGAQWPDVAVSVLAIAARREDDQLQERPVTPCGSCRQVLLETERRFGHPVRLLLCGRRCVYVVDGVEALMPLSFTEF